MIIKKRADAPVQTMSDHEGMTKQVVLGPKDVSEEIVMRYFSLEPGASSPRHTHDFPHLVHIHKGNGAAIDANGKEHALIEGDYIYIDDNELHSLKNTGSEHFDFTCTVPGRGEA